MTTEGFPHRPIEIAHLEVALFQMLERPPWLMFGVPRQMDLAILADLFAIFANQDRSIEAMRLGAPLLDFGITQR